MKYILSKTFCLKNIVTLISITALIFFVGYILFKIKMDKEIALLFFGSFISSINMIMVYYFTRKASDSIHNEEGDVKKWHT